MRRIALVVMAIAALSAASCIKEDRSQCPCYLHLDLKGVDKDYIHSLDLMFEDEASDKWLAVEDRYFGDTLILPVDKSEFDFCAWGNLSPESIDRSRRSVIPKEPLDTLWSYSRKIVTRCEDVYVTVVPQREYIPVLIIVRGDTEGVSDVAPRLCNISTAFSYDGRSAGPLESLRPQRVYPPEARDGEYLFQTMLYTQQSATQASLELSFMRDGRLVGGSYSIGEMLTEMGEDISLRNRNPIIIDLLLSGGGVFLTLKVADWMRHSVIDITY